MKQVLLKVLVLISVGMCLGLLPGQARADSGFDKSIGDMFGTMSNVTDPHVFMSAKRGVISGGGIEVRNRTMNVNLYNFQMPSLSVGCNGISAFFGSFSFISKDQLLQAMRSIATAAVMYAFKIALAAMCPTCEEKLAALQDKMDKLNMSNINACEIGEKLVADSKLGAAIEEKAKAFGQAFGRKDDYEDASNRGEGKAPSADAAAAMSPEMKKEVFKGNQGWRIMKEKGLGKWAIGVSNELLMDVMSYTGTVVACVPNVDTGCPSRNKAKGATDEVSVRIMDPVLSLSNLVKGSKGSDKVMRYVCNENNDCLNPVPTEITDFKGIETRILEVFTGAAGKGGIIAKVAVPGAVGPTDSDIGWIVNTGSYGQIVLNLAKTNPDAAVGFVNTFAEEMAVTVVSEIMRGYLQATLIAMSQEEQGETSEFRTMAIDALKRLRQESEPFYNKANGRVEHVNYYRSLSEISTPRTNLTMAPAK